MPNFHIPSSALNAFDVTMQTTANNIANMNTDGFKSSRVVLESGPYQDEGVRVSAIHRDMSPGPAVINHLSENDVRDVLDVSASKMRISQENYDSMSIQDIDRLQQANAVDAWKIENYREGRDANAQIMGISEGSNTDLSREFTTMIMTENAYSASAALIRAWDEFTGGIISMKV